MNFGEGSILLQIRECSSVSADNKVYTISNKNGCMQGDGTLKFPFVVKFPADTSFRAPTVARIRLNNAQICPEPGNTSCGKFQMTRNATGGRWDGTLTVHPRESKKQIKVGIELHQPALSLNVIINEQVSSWISYQSSLIILE